MYHPYFRGKQYELVVIREAAALMKDAGFVPIVEPVKESFGGLKRALEAVATEGGEAVVLLNPQHGDQVDNTDGIESWLTERFGGARGIGVGVIAGPKQSASDIVKVFSRHHADRKVTIIHDGFTDGVALVNELGEDLKEIRHVFTEASSGKLYQKAFRRPCQRVLLRDGFQRRKNRDHPPTEPFSELHVTFKEEEGMDGFGDYLIVGDEYSDSGGPAYAVAIHLTFIDPDQADQMFIHHFVSDSNDTPTDPAGKFKEALDRLKKEVDREGSAVLRTQAVEEFLSLHESQHYPGLGYVKKLSMRHHIETLARYFEHPR